MATDIQAQDAHFAAEFSPDVDAEKVGSVYAAALFGALDDDLQKIGEVLGELRDFLKEAFDAFPEFEKTLVSRLVSVEDKLGILDRVFASKVSPVFFSFLQTVVKRERMDCLRAIYSEAVKIYDKLAGRVPVVICTATPISDDVVEAIKEKLREKFSGEPLVSCQVDPSQIGGLVVRVGDTIYDASLATQLEDIRRNIIKKYAPQL